METNKPLRRKRYSGKYPKKFEDKYKEKQPEKYQDIIEHFIQKGNTPAGMHRSIMVDEILAFFDIKPHQVGLDATLGFGGHFKAMLEKLNHTGHMHGIDTDPIELPKTYQRLINSGYTDQDFTLHPINFKDLDLIETKGYDFIIADLGVSSMQIDDPSRGFTFKSNGPLDLRMNPNVGISATLRLRDMSFEEIKGMLIENADETYADEIAREIINARLNGDFLETTKALQHTIEKALRGLPRSTQEQAIKKASQRTFQALRIDVNHEYEALYEFLEKVPQFLKPNGKVAILSFHSGEDRFIKKAFQHYYREGVYKEIQGPDIPSLDEVHTNPRARSAKLRCAIKA